MKTNNIGHNNPPKNERKSVDYLISLRQKIDSKKVKCMHPRLVDDKYKPTQISDTEVNGFHAICTRPGVIAFHVRHAGKKYKCGDYLGTSTSITNSREMALKFIEAIRLGKDPEKVRKENEEKPTFGTVVEMLLKDKDYLSNFKKGMSRNQFVWRLNTYFLHNAKRPDLRKFIIKNHVDLDLKNLKIDSVTKEDLMRFYNVIKKRGTRGVIANRCLEDTRAIFKFAIKKKYCETNPAKYSKKGDKLVEEMHRIETIDPYSLEEQLRLKVTFTKQHKDPRLLVASRALNLILSVGARNRSEIYNAKWKNIITKGNKYYLHIPDSKTGKKSYRLNEEALSIVKELRDYKEKKDHPLNIPMRDMRSRYLFPSVRKKSSKIHITDIRKSFRKLCEMASVRVLPIYMLKHSYWTLADLPTEEMQKYGGWESASAPLIYKAYTDKKEDEINDTVNDKMLVFRNARAAQ